MSNAGQLILVTGATGKQGGGVARELLAHGHRVRFLTRDPSAAAAAPLLKAGAEASRGDMGDTTSLAAAMRGVSGVFSMQPIDGSGDDSEMRYATALVQAALKANVRHFVHTSVAATDRHTHFPRWGTQYWFEKYWTDKWAIEEYVRHAGLASWTVQRPALLMSNFTPPTVQFMFPHLKNGEIVTALKPDTRMDLIAAEDIGAFARAAFEDPARFNGKSIDLASESLTMGEAAAILTRVTGKKVTAVSLSPDETKARGIYAGWVNSMEWANEVGYQVDIAALKSYGIPLMTFEHWARKHSTDFVFD